MLSYKVLRVDVNREQGQIKKVSETRPKLRLEDLARVPPVGIIKGLLVWPDNCMLLHVHLHVHGPFFSVVAAVGSFWIIGGQHQHSRGECKDFPPMYMKPGTSLFSLIFRLLSVWGIEGTPNPPL